MFLPTLIASLHVSDRDFAFLLVAPFLWLLLAILGSSCIYQSIRRKRLPGKSLLLSLLVVLGLLLLAYGLH